jgi:hypothetical protein
MIVLFTDFGLHGPYTGQMKAVAGPHRLDLAAPALRNLMFDVAYPFGLKHDDG